MRSKTITISFYLLLISKVGFNLIQLEDSFLTFAVIFSPPPSQESRGPCEIPPGSRPERDGLQRVLGVEHPCGCLQRVTCPPEVVV